MARCPNDIADIAGICYPARTLAVRALGHSSIMVCRAKSTLRAATRSARRRPRIAFGATNFKVIAR
jgi:hypothetical protein